VSPNQKTFGFESGGIKILAILLGPPERRVFRLLLAAKLMQSVPEQARYGIRDLPVLPAKTHFLFRSLCNRLLKRILNRFQISGIWLQAHFEIIEDRLLVGFGCGDFLEVHVAQHDFIAPDCCQALNHVAYRPLAIFVGAVGGE
jgi:hypothetical protein